MQSLCGGRHHGVVILRFISVVVVVIFGAACRGVAARAGDGDCALRAAVLVLRAENASSIHRVVELEFGRVIDMVWCIKQPPA